MKKSYVQSFRVQRLRIRERIRNIRRHPRTVRFERFLVARPFTSFFVTLGIVLALIIAGNVLSGLSREEAEAQPVVKSVSVYHIGEAPHVTLQAKVDKKGVVQIVAQTAGIVQKINRHEGESVTKGTNLLSLSSSYAGGNAASVQRAIAQTQYTNVLETYDAQKELIRQQRDVANTTAENNEELRDITRRSLDDTRGSLTTNEAILGTLRENLETLEDTNVSGANDAMILQTSQLVAQAEGGVNQLRASIRQLELQNDEDDPAVELQGLQKDIALKQLEIQEKSLDLNREVSRLQVALASISESLMFPASPVSGTVEKIFVSVGESVAPGTPLAVISGSDNTVHATVQVPRNIALTVSRSEPSTLHLNGTDIDIVPYYVSANATDGSLHTLFYAIEPKFEREVAHEEYITVDVPLSSMQSEQAIPYVPIDSVYQTQSEAYVYVIEDGKAASKTVTLGDVYGRYAEVKSGLTRGDRVILNRNVVAGDRVQAR